MCEMPWEFVSQIDEWLDDKVSADYHNQPLAQHWARVTKVGEELGEAISELILLTGQNPRKPIDMTAYERLLNELADTAWTAILAMQHFTKDTFDTEQMLREKLNSIHKRMAESH